MTDKEKAKTYDDAIERVKKLYSNGIAKKIFPELKESKEKKIGEIFEFNNNVKLKVIKNDTCGGCYFYNPDKCDCLERRRYDVTGSCCRTRSDGQNVIFAKIEE